MDSISAVIHGAHQHFTPVEDANPQAPSDEQEKDSSSLSSSTSSDNIWDLFAPSNLFRLAYTTGYDTSSSEKENSFLSSSDDELEITASTDSEESPLGPFFGQLPLDILTQELPKLLGLQEWFRTLAPTCKAFYNLTQETKVIEQIATNMGICFEEKTLETIKARLPFSFSTKVKILTRENNPEVRKILQKTQNASKALRPFTEAINSAYNHSLIEKMTKQNSLIPSEIINFVLENRLEVDKVQVLKNHDAVLSIINFWERVFATANLKPCPRDDKFSESLAFAEEEAIKFSKIGNNPKTKSAIKEIKEINFDNMQLTTLASEVSYLERLKILSLQSNHLRSLPSSLKTLSLTKLNLRDNYFTSFSSQLLNISTLAELNLSLNFLTQFPPELFELKNLIVLNLSDNEIYQIPKKISFFEGLVSLDLAHNKISALPDEICSLKHLTHLRLSNNKFKNFPQQIFQLNLGVLHLDHNLISHLPYLDELNDLFCFCISNNTLTIPPDFKWPPRLFYAPDASHQEITPQPPSLSEECLSKGALAISLSDVIETYSSSESENESDDWE